MENSDDKKNIVIDTTIKQELLKQKPNLKLGITQDYNKENRNKLWDSTQRKAEYKDKVFGDKQTYKDVISGRTLHKSTNAAKNKYHMKNADGENVSSKWSQYSAETDHINAIKDVHKVAKHNAFLSDENFREIINSDENYRVISKSLNTSKGDKSDWKLVLDKENNLSTEARKQISKEKIKADAVLHSKFAVRTAKNMGTEFVSGAKDTLINSAIPLTAEAVNKMVKIAQGKITAKEAVKDMSKTVVDVAVVGGTNKLLITAVTNSMANSQSQLLNSIANSSEVGKLIAVATILKESAVRYVDGEIDGKEFVEEVGEKGAVLVAGMIGGQIGREIGQLIGASVGVVAGPVGMVVGYAAVGFIGQVLGTIITTISCSSIISAYKVSKNLDSYKLKERQVKRIESDALREMGRQRKLFKEIVLRENQKYDQEIQEGFDMIVSSICKASYDLDGVTDGIDKILSIFGKEVAFKTLDEYEAQLDSTLSLSF